MLNKRRLLLTAQYGVMLGACASVLVPTAAIAGPWINGPQPTDYSSEMLGDGSNSRGGEAPFYSAGEPDDIPTNSTIRTNWTVACSPTDLGTTCGEFHDKVNGGNEAKARFDCNITFNAKTDPLLFPGVVNGSPHKHSFFGNNGYTSNSETATYALLRASGYSTCYAGPLNRTLYWEPDMMVDSKDGIPTVIQPFNIVTYYICGDSIQPVGVQKGPVNCSRWPRSFNFIFGFNTGDPSNTHLSTIVANANAAGPGSFRMPPAEFLGWLCYTPQGTGYTSYAPVKTTNAAQPYLNDGLGHATLDCASTTVNGESRIQVFADLVSPDCWDGINPTSPNARYHLVQRIINNTTGGYVCPKHWYLTEHFEAKPSFSFKDATEMGKVYLSSDRMPGMTQWEGGRSMHADLFPAWDYGTGDDPGMMVTFFQHCNGISMHLKNSDGVTYTDLVGDPHECGFARTSATTSGVTNVAPPDGVGPNPVVNLNPDQTGIKRYFPLDPGLTVTLVNHAHKN